MKKKKLNKKLTLNKEIITNFNLSKIKGGSKVVSVDICQVTIVNGICPL